MIRIHPPKSINMDLSINSFIEEFFSEATQNEVFFYDLENEITDISEDGITVIGKPANFFGGNCLLQAYDLLKYFSVGLVFYFTRIVTLSLPKDLPSKDSFPFLFNLTLNDRYSYKEITPNWTLLFFNDFPIMAIYQIVVGDQRKTLVLSLTEITRYKIFPATLYEKCLEYCDLFKNAFESNLVDYLSFYEEGSQIEND